jgi:hypothetical protein
MKFVLYDDLQIAKERTLKYLILTELWPKNQFLTAIFKSAAILKQSKIPRVLEMELVVHILKLIFAKFEENPRCTF